MKKYTLLFFLLIVNSIAFNQTNGTSIFDDSYVHEIKLTFDQTNYLDSLQYYYLDFLDNGADKQYMLAGVEIDGVIVDSVGVREKGFYSNWGVTGAKKPLKINFKTYIDDQRFDGLKKLNLQNGFKDPTMMRDALAYKFMRDAGIPAPRSSYAKLFINNAYWGLFIIVEQVDSRFLKNWYDDNDGNLFKCIDNTNFDWQGSNYSNYEDEFELKTNKLANDWSGFIDLAGKINNDAQFEDSIRKRLNISGYLKVLAADVLMYNWDSYYDHGRNFYIYQDSTTGIFHWIPWDYNLSFSDSPTNVLITYLNAGGMGGTEPKPLVENVMSSNQFRSKYFNEICIMLDETFNLDNLEDYIDDQKALITQAFDDDPNKFYTLNEFNTSFTSDITLTDQFGFTEIIKGLKPFISGRYQTVHNQFSTHGHNCTSLGLNDEMGSRKNMVYPNPSNGLFEFNLHDGIEKIEIYTANGQIMKTISSQENTTIDLTNFPSGIYLAHLRGNSNYEVMKLIKR